ncbi:t26-17p [Pyrococcus sp. NA2]|uniref:t26-17p n=1 Tax=Pyrococcus sp. (strain NA2) TaxID=342949 RepID=UPI001ED8C1C7|nr:t26-17p [Pyrococcus sp. NA2]
MVGIMLKVKIHRQVKRQRKRGKVYNIEQRVIYIPSKAELPEEVYILSPQELQELVELIPEEKRPDWLVVE